MNINLWEKHGSKKMVEILWFQDFQVGREDSFYFMLMGFSTHCLIICNSIIPREIKTHYEKWDSLKGLCKPKNSHLTTIRPKFLDEFWTLFQFFKLAKTRQFQPHFWQSFVPEKVWYEMREIKCELFKEVLLLKKSREMIVCHSS